MTEPTVLDVVIAASSGLAALGKIILAWLGFRNLPPIRRRLTDSQKIVGELHELLLQLAKSPRESVTEQRTVAEPVLFADVRHARHDPVFDRIVFDFVHLVPGYTITPLTEADLREGEMQGSWGLGAILKDCRSRYQGASTKAPPRLWRSWGDRDIPRLRSTGWSVRTATRLSGQSALLARRSIWPSSWTVRPGS